MDGKPSCLSGSPVPFSRRARQSTCCRGPGWSRPPRRPASRWTCPAAARASAASAAWWSASGAAEPPAPQERAPLATTSSPAGWRLACQSSVAGPTTVEVPAHVAAGRRSQDPRPHRRARRPANRPTRRSASGTSSCRRRPAATTRPTWCGSERRAGPARRRPGAAARSCPAGCAQADFRGTAVLADRRLIDFEPGDTEAEAFAVAVDVGTTTLVGDARGPEHGRGAGRRLAAESADRLRRRRALAHPARPAEPRRGSSELHAGGRRGRRRDDRRAGRAGGRRRASGSTS